ncbi:MAG: glycosyltransferase family 2 protein [Chitinophagaceae bacterium]|nr:glycosyltransferase family 2 protein [Chitinophagaceae bacterium]
MNLDISIIVPLKNEEESLPELCTWIETVMNANKFSYEIILVDDGSTDESWNVINQLNSENSNIKGLKFQRNYGKSAALNEGFKASLGNVVITMDADLQDSPDEVPELYKMIAVDGFDMVSGWKKKRYDNVITKNLPSKFFNAVTRKISGIYLHDFNCGLKAYRRKLVKSIEIYGEMHRYIPVLAKWAGFRKIGEKVVEHRPRKYGTTKFGWERFVNGFLDLTSLMFIGKFGKKPMQFFGLLGSAFFFFGSMLTLYLVFAKLIYNNYPLTNKPGFYLAMTMVILGSQFFLAGFIGELIVRNASERNVYMTDEKIGFTDENH